MSILSQNIQYKPIAYPDDSEYNAGLLLDANDIDYEIGELRTSIEESEQELLDIQAQLKEGNDVLQKCKEHPTGPYTEKGKKLIAELEESLGKLKPFIYECHGSIADDTEEIVRLEQFRMHSTARGEAVDLFIRGVEKGYITLSTMAGGQYNLRLEYAIDADRYMRMLNVLSKGCWVIKWQSEVYFAKFDIEDRAEKLINERLKKTKKPDLDSLLEQFREETEDVS